MRWLRSFGPGGKLSADPLKSRSDAPERASRVRDFNTAAVRPPPQAFGGGLTFWTARPVNASYHAHQAWAPAWRALLA